MQIASPIPQTLSWPLQKSIPFLKFTLFLPPSITRVKVPLFLPPPSYIGTRGDSESPINPGGRLRGWTRGGRGKGDDRWRGALNENASGNRESRNSIREDRAREWFRWPWNPRPVCRSYWNFSRRETLRWKFLRRGWNLAIWSRQFSKTNCRTVSSGPDRFSFEIGIWLRSLSISQSVIDRAIFTSNLMVIIKNISRSSHGWFVFYFGCYMNK